MQFDQFSFCKWPIIKQPSGHTGWQQKFFSMDPRPAWRTCSSREIQANRKPAEKQNNITNFFGQWLWQSGRFQHKKIRVRIQPENYGQFYNDHLFSVNCLK